MRAVRVDEHGDPSVLSLAEVPAPEVSPGTVRIDVATAGVNFADLAKRRGTYPDGPTPPYTPGIEAAGRVAAAGEETPFATGDRVMAYAPTGGYAEQVVVDADRVFPVPDGLSLATAAGVPVQWLTAHNTLFEWGGLVADERVLVLAGAGGVGSAAVQLATTAGADVLATASTSEKRAFVRELGADHAIDYVDEDMAAAVRKTTGGAGVDLVLDGVGGEAFRASLDALAPGGRIVAYGLASGEVPRVSTPRLLFENHAVLGYHLGHAADHQPDRVFSAMERLDELLAAGTVAVQIDRTFPLEAADRAHEYVRDRKTTGKVVLEV